MKKKIKLLFCINTLAIKGGGAEKVLSIVLNHLSNENFDIKLITFDKKKAKFFYNFSKKIDTYNLGELIIFKNKYLVQINRILILTWYLLKIKPKISFGFMHSIYVNLAIASIISKSKVVGCEHILPEHFVDKKIEFFLIKVVFFLLNKITVVSDQVKKKFGPFLRKKMVVINNVVDTSDYNKKNKLKRKKIILAVGRLVKQKNFSILISAFFFFNKKNKGWKLNIIGEGEEKKNLIRQINYLNLQEKIKIINYSKKLNQFYKKSSIYVSSSIYESFGLTVAEALIYGLPCIDFRKCTGVNKIISHNKNGLLIDSSFDNSIKLAEEIDKLANDKKKLKQMQNYYDPKFLTKNSHGHVFKVWKKLIWQLVR
jgi:GalNAc-alpha-(1->4)-GalNAc-alpha-(1->3)-diNAcBac-PP-undecaprenol alpha-1,4-N-acetyl-D-galactosaminyltransferase